MSLHISFDFCYFSETDKSDLAFDKNKKKTNLLDKTMDICYNNSIPNRFDLMEVKVKYLILPMN